jgi:hypothetical protein
MPEKLTKCLVMRHWKSRRKCSQPLSSSRHKQQTEEEEYGVDAEQTSLALITKQAISNSHTVQFRTAHINSSQSAVSSPVSW